LLDTRDANAFAKAHIPNSINIGIDGNFAPWVGALITDIKQAILIIADEGREQEVITRLSRVGFDHSIGCLKGGIAAWQAAGFTTNQIKRLSPTEFATTYKAGTLTIDVRNAAEFRSEHLTHAINIPLDYINEHLSEFPKDKAFVIHCAGGYRSMIAASILSARGWQNLVDVEGGFTAIKPLKLETISKACQSNKA
jgi:rhodanese-related sulfurtransferase